MKFAAKCSANDFNNHQSNDIEIFQEKKIRAATVLLDQEREGKLLTETLLNDQ
jgi:hypothetical protein